MQQHELIPNNLQELTTLLVLHKEIYALNCCGHARNDKPKYKALDGPKVKIKYKKTVIDAG
jgi:hypothetical protein